jgi:putative aldouronate transport system permease protein
MRVKNSNKNQISSGWNVVFNIILILFCTACIYPLLIVLGTSFTDEASITQFGYNIIPAKFSINSYKYIFTGASTIVNAYGITIFVTVVGTILSILMTSLYAYPLSRRELKYRKFFTIFLFITMVFGGGLVPWYLVCTRLLNLQNSIGALIVPALMNSFYVIVLRTFYQTTIPDAIIESARIDGANDITTFFKIVMPLSLPGIATIAIFSSIHYWNDWWLPLMLVSKPKFYNLQFLLKQVMDNVNFLQSAKDIPGLSNTTIPSEGMRMATCILTIGPIIFVYPFFQKYFVKGLVVGSVKG